MCSCELRLDVSIRFCLVASHFFVAFTFFDCLLDGTVWAELPLTPVFATGGTWMGLGTFIPTKIHLEKRRKKPKDKSDRRKGLLRLEFLYQKMCPAFPCHGQS